MENIINKMPRKAGKILVRNNIFLSAGMAIPAMNNRSTI